MEDPTRMSPEERRAYCQDRIALLTPPANHWQEMMLGIYQSLLDGSEEPEGGSVDE